MPTWGAAMKDRIEAKDEDPTINRIRNLANRFIVGLLQMVTFGIVKYISESVGTDKVAETFTDIASQSSNASIPVIDLSIRLDHFEHFPQAQIDGLAKEFANNPFAFGVLQYLAWFRFHMYSIDFPIKQRVCQKLSIPIEYPSRIAPYLEGSTLSSNDTPASPSSEAPVG